MKQGGDRRAGGFTIIEVLIVLAVTGALFIIVAIVINGRQARTEFQVAINGLQQQFQQIINETANGYYPNSSNFSCAGAAAAGVPPTISSGSNKQGTNQGCIFLGKAIRFGSGVASGTADDNTITVYPVVGNRQDAVTHTEVTSYAAAVPTLIAKGQNSPYDSIPEDSTVLTLDSGLRFIKAAYNGGGWDTTHHIGVVEFLGSLGSYSGGSLNSGAQQLNLYGTATGPKPWGSAQVADKSVVDTTDINGLYPNSATPTPFTKVDLCFASGTTQQSGLITIGGTSSLGVTLKIFEGSTTC